MSTPITISYDLNPPESVETELVEAKQASFTVRKAPADGHKVYYAALRDAIQLARNQVGDELTAWRDVVGKAEVNMEARVADDEGEEEFEEEGGDES